MDYHYDEDHDFELMLELLRAVREDDDDYGDFDLLLEVMHAALEDDADVVQHAQ